MVVGVAQPFKRSCDNSVMSLSVANIIMISVLNIYLLDHYHGNRDDPTMVAADTSGATSHLHHCLCVVEGKEEGAGLEEGSACRGTVCQLQ